MKKKNVKKLISLVILLAVFGGLIAGFAALKNFNAQEDEPEEEDTSFVVFDKGTPIITAISFKSEKNELAFSYVNEDWVYDADANYPLDQDGVAKMAAAVGKVTAQLKVEDAVEDLSEYGLSPAALTVKATFSDKSEKTFLFGSKNSFNSCQYFMISGDENVYMVAEDVSSPFGVDLDYLYEPESYILQKNSVTDSDITAITITTAGGQSKVINDDEGILDLYELVYSLDLSDYEDYYADESEMLYDYGISKESERITVSYTEEDDNGNAVPKDYVIYIGYKYENAESDSDSSGTADTTTSADGKKSHSYFYTFEGSTVVYTVDGETVDEIFEFLAYEPKVEETTAP